MPLRLKSLELHGYKTFANRTVFEFADTVTAVVGPNGSGKSNIADSLRWVLGEQSYSLLRGKKTEDMIFAGSESRTRAGMASATITFDNSSDWLPIDFSEVAITRRAYRDGSNEYLINGQRVRLKDVSELLARSGLAERTYTVIGQGLVDAALSLKADERRRLFEEAAGIGLHRARREEAIRRLDTTRRNLDRVQDILAELKPRLNSLERQARRAIDYDHLRADLNLLLREWYGYHWRLAQHELAEVQNAIEKHEVRLEKARTETGAVEAQSADVRRQLLERRTELSGYHKQLSGLHAQREALGRELAVLAERLDALKNQEKEIDTEALRQNEELLIAEQAVSSAEKRIETLQDELDEASRRREEHQASLAFRLEERREIEQRIQTHRQELGKMNTRLGQLQAYQEETRLAGRRAEKLLADAETGLAKIELDRQEAESGYKRAGELTLKTINALRAAEEAAAEQLRKVETAEAERRQVEVERSTRLADLARVRARREVLDQAERSLSGYAVGARRLLQAARDGSLQGRGALSAYIQAPPELETAIAAVLGEFLDALVIEGDPEAALDLLQSGAGRGALLPVTSLNLGVRGAEPSSSDGDWIGVAASMVKYPAELRSAVEILLGRVWVVRDRAAARRLLEKLPVDGRMVTLDGVIFYAGGPISAGRAETSGNSSLGRNRERRDLSAETGRLEDAVHELETRLSTMDASLVDNRQEFGRRSAAVEECRRNLREAQRAEETARSALLAAERQAAWELEQRQRLQVDLDRSRAETLKLNAERGELETRLADRRSLLTDESRRLELLALDEMQTQVAHWNTRLAVAERALDDARLQLEERQERYNRLTRSAAAYGERRQVLDAGQTEIHTRMNQLRSENDLVAAGLHALNLQIEPAEADVERMEAESEALQRLETEARQGLSIADHIHSQTRITLARRQETVQSLQRRIEEDFGLVAFEYEEKVSGQTPLPLDGMVEQLPVVKRLSPDVEENIKRQRAQLRRLGAINPEAQAEYTEVKERFEFLTAQVGDLHAAEEDIREVIVELDGVMQREFRRTFEAVAEEFHVSFTRLFGGGSARLLLTDPDDLNETGIEIQARLPGRRAQGLALLSGGERSLTAVALVFSLLKVSPTPFCVLDEVDAMLDEVNVGRFRELLRELAQTTQFVIITHNRNTVQAADVIYGVTMGRDSASQVLSLKLDEVDKVVD